jgi:hypothetical protein
MSVLMVDNDDDKIFHLKILSFTYVEDCVIANHVLFFLSGFSLTAVELDKKFICVSISILFLNILSLVNYRKCLHSFIHSSTPLGMKASTTLITSVCTLHLLSTHSHTKYTG